MDKAAILYCHCQYAQVVPKDVKEAVLRRLCESGVAFDAVADLCEMSARRDPALKQLAASGEFTNAWNSHAPMGQLFNEPAVKSILQNNELMDVVWVTVQTNLDDLVIYLKTGKSQKFDAQTILGRWDFNVSTTVAMLRQARPNIQASEMKAIRALWTQGFADTTFVGSGDGQAFLKNLPNFKNQPPTRETWKGSWTENGTNYDLALTSDGENKAMTAQASGSRLTLKDDKTTLIFDRED